MLLVMAQGRKAARPCGIQCPGVCLGAAWSQDEMVPPSQMYELHALAKGAVKDLALLRVPGAHHMDAYDHSPDLYWSALRAFLDKHVLH